MAVITGCKSKKQYQSKNIWSVNTSPLPSVSNSPIGHSLMLESDSLPTIGSGLKYEGGELVPTPGKLDTVFTLNRGTDIWEVNHITKNGFNAPVVRSSFISTDKNGIGETSDTTAVYMLITDKVEHDYPTMLRQVKGYSVTKGNSIVSTHLNIHKQPLPDDVIVWMSIQR